MLKIRETKRGEKVSQMETKEKIIFSEEGRIYMDDDRAKEAAALAEDIYDTEGDLSMTEQVIKNNVAEIVGKIEGELVYSHTVYGEDFYTVKVRVPRLSSSFDEIPMMISNRLLDAQEDYTNRIIRAEGQFRSYNQHIEGKSKLVLSLFVRDLELLDITEEEVSRHISPNQIYLDGFICKKPIYRKTPLGREITDMLLAVNRPYNKSDYIPAIAWGRNARFAAGFTVGSRVKIWGRIQSRQYQKHIGEEGQVEQRTAYEISISKMETCEENHTAC